MRVLDHEPYAWFLLEDSGVLLLDVLCSHGIVDYGVLIALDPTEAERGQAMGRAYLNQLARDINDSKPGVIGSFAVHVAKPGAWAGKRRRKGCRGLARRRFEPRGATGLKRVRFASILRSGLRRSGRRPLVCAGQAGPQSHSAALGHPSRS